MSMAYPVRYFRNYKLGTQFPSAYQDYRRERILYTNLYHLWQTGFGALGIPLLTLWEITTSVTVSWNTVTWVLRIYQCFLIWKWIWQEKDIRGFYEKHHQIVLPRIQRGRSLMSGNKFLINTENQIHSMVCTLANQCTLMFMKYFSLCI